MPTLLTRPYHFDRLTLSWSDLLRLALGGTLKAGALLISRSGHSPGESAVTADTAGDGRPPHSAHD